MKKSTIKILICDVIFLILTLLNVFVISINNLFILSLFNIIFAALIIFLFGFKKNRNRYRKDIILNIVIYSFGYMFLFYLSGLFLGFLNNVYSLKIQNIFTNIISMLAFILSTEFFRYCLNTESQSNKFLICISVIIFIFIDLNLYIGNYNLTNAFDLLKLIWCITIPLLSKNILLTFTSIRYGALSTISYRVIMELYIFIVPFVPNIDEYLTAVLGVLFPAFVAFMIYNSYIKKEKNIDLRAKKGEKYIGRTLLFFSVVIVLLTSQLLPLFIMTVGSGSMARTINVGDVLIVRKTKNVKKGDIIVFKYDGKIIVHRVVNKYEEEKELLFKTKGDNNQEIDNWVLNKDNIIGKALFRIPVIGYPTVWLNRNIIE